MNTFQRAMNKRHMQKRKPRTKGENEFMTHELQWRQQQMYQ